MDVRSRTRRNLTPVVGGITAMATATGAFAAVAHVAPAGAEPGSATSALGTTGLTGAGAFEACSAYFGFGKEEGVLGVVEFDVADVNGDDDRAHEVDVDTTVRLVLENDEGGILECVPVAITEADWIDEFGSEPFLPTHPGSGHFAYPSVNLDPFIDGFGDVVAVGFRVTTIPSEHTLVSPEDVQELDDLFLDPEAVFDHVIIDPRVVDHIAAEVDAAAAAAYEAAVAACDAGDDFDGTDPDLIAGLEELEDVTDNDEVGTDASCFDIGILGAFGSLVLGVFASTEYMEEIRLSVPEGPPPTTPPPVAPPAAQPVAAAPQFTG